MDEDRIVPYDPDNDSDPEDLAAGHPCRDALTRRLNVLDKSPLSSIPEPEVRTFDANEIIPTVRIEELPFKYRTLCSGIQEFNATQSAVYKTIFNGDNSIAISSPTGSGKTLVFELAIIKALVDHEKVCAGKFNKKIIYLAPLKALCSEKCKDWSERFSQFMKVSELTGDSDADDSAKMRRSNLIVTTPEKWDSVTRKWTNENLAMMDSTILVCIDEIHMLGEEVRGAAIEALISRIKLSKELTSTSSCRFVAASATAPNIRDIGKWLGQPGLRTICFKLGDEYRTCKLKMEVRGYDYRIGSPHQFDHLLNNHMSEVVRQFAENKPTLVFCMTRKSAEGAAKKCAENRRISTNMQLDVRTKLILLETQIENVNLKKLIIYGTAFHHAGLSPDDKKLVEQAFRDGLIEILCATSTLSMGINLPAHLVIIKGTDKWAGPDGPQPYTETEITQMAGRAGRPQYDQSGVCVIMCRSGSESKYLAYSKGEKIIESNLHKNLSSHLNAEIVLGTITDASHALRWLKSTFFYIRCLLNKPAYGFNDCFTSENVEARLKNLLIAELNGLMKEGLIKMKPDGTDIAATDAGKLMASYYIHFETMKSLIKIKKNSTIKNVLELICSCKEISQEITLRHEDKTSLFAVNCTSKQLVRFPSDEKIKTSAQKALVLIQVEFGNIEDATINKKFLFDRNRLRRLGKKLASCLAEYVCLNSIRYELGFMTVRSVILVAKMFRSGLWENSPHVFKQFLDIGIKASSTFVRAGLTNVQVMAEKALPADIDGMCNRHSPFGVTLITAARGVPLYSIDLRQLTFDPYEIEARVDIEMTNWEEISKRFNDPRKSGDRKFLPAGTHHSWYFIVGDGKGDIVFFTRVTDQMMIQSKGLVTHLFPVKKTDGADRISVSLISEKWVGGDILKKTYAVDFTAPEEIAQHQVYAYSTQEEVESRNGTPENGVKRLKSDEKRFY